MISSFVSVVLVIEFRVWGKLNIDSTIELHLLPLICFKSLILLNFILNTSKSFPKVANSLHFSPRAVFVFFFFSSWSRFIWNLPFGWQINIPDAGILCVSITRHEEMLPPLAPKALKALSPRWWDACSYLVTSTVRCKGVTVQNLLSNKAQHKLAWPGLACVPPCQV